MALTVTTGIAREIKAGDDFAWVTVQTPEANAFFLIWLGPHTGGGNTAVYTNLLTEAVNRGAQVSIIHDDASSYVSGVTLFAPL